MIVLGSFKGGTFCIQDREKPAEPAKIDTRNQWILFDGLRTHWSTPITAGTRYSVIAFAFKDRG